MNNTKIELEYEMDDEILSYRQNESASTDFVRTETVDNISNRIIHDTPDYVHVDSLKIKQEDINYELGVYKEIENHGTEIETCTKRIKSGEYTKMKGTGSSDVWIYFEKIVKADTKEVQLFVICKTCEKLFTYGKGCSPSNLKKHRCYKRQKVEGNSPDTDNMCKKSCVSVSDEIRKEIIKSCVNYIAGDLRPFDTVHGDGFKELARSLIETGVKLGTKNFAVDDILPQSTTVSRELQKLYATEIEVFIASLRPIIEKGLCAATMDMWTESKKRRHFISLTVHYMDSTNHQLHNRILCTMEVQNCHEDGNAAKKSTENIIRAIEDKFEHLKLPRNLHKKIYFTTDQESNIKQALQHHTRINCMADVLNIILKHTFDKEKLKECAPHVLDLITNCKGLVEYLKRTGMAQMLETTAVCKQECFSGWNTKFGMLFTVRQNLNAIKEMVFKSGDSNRLIGIEKSLLDRVLVFLKLFKSATLLFECENTPTIHSVLLHMHILKEKIIHLRNEESNNEVQSIFIHCLDNVFDVQFVPHRIHKIAAFLWPEYKQLRYLNEFEREEVYGIVKEELSNFTSTKNVPSNSSAGSLSISTETTGNEEFNDDNILNKYKDVHHTTNNVHFQNQMNAEIELYKNCFFVDGNILQWWRFHEKEFPLLAKLARQILCIPASSAASERCFSSANRALAERRSHLKDDHVDAILFLHSQHKKE